MIRLSIIFAILLFSSCNISREGKEKQNLEIRSYMEGKRLYNSACQQCHEENGEGYKSLYPSLSKSSLISKNDFLPCIIKNGTRDLKTSSDLVKMPPNPELTPEMITDICNYLIEEWADSTAFFSLTEIESTLKKCKQQQ